MIVRARTRRLRTASSGSNSLSHFGEGAGRLPRSKKLAWGFGQICLVPSSGFAKGGDPLKMCVVCAERRRPLPRAKAAVKASALCISPIPEAVSTDDGGPPDRQARGSLARDGPRSGG